MDIIQPQLQHVDNDIDDNVYKDANNNIDVKDWL